MNDTRTTRAIETTLEIHAAVEAVWRAFTDAGELVRWFPLKAEADSRSGGRVRLSWGGGVSWEMTVDHSDAPRRFRWIIDREPGRAQPEGAPYRLAVEVELEGLGGETRLRLVHSGFGADADWDEEFDGTRRGWIFELQSLKTYVEQHRGRVRDVIMVRRAVTGDPARAFRRLVGGNGAVFTGSVEGRLEGDRYRLSGPGGDAWEGRVILPAGASEFAGTVEGSSTGLFRVAVESGHGPPQTWTWLSQWDADRAGVVKRRRAWEEAVGKAFPG